VNEKKVVALALLPIGPLEFEERRGTIRARRPASGPGARAVAGPGTRVEAVTSSMGPASIESHYDEALSVPGLLAEIARAQAGAPRADGFVIACFGDPGLHAARELGVENYLDLLPRGYSWWLRRREEIREVTRKANANEG